MALGSNYLADLFFEHVEKTVDKWEHYIAIYSHELAPFLARRQPVRLLEVGVQNGGSLELWAKYLPEGSEIAGIDIDPAVRNLTFEGPVRVHVADATDSIRIAEVFGDKYFDVIIDDASHKSNDVIATFSTLFEKLAPGGKYVIEDLHASYWKSNGGFRVASSSIEYFKNLVDALNADHLENTGTIGEGILADLRKFGRSLARITFYDSVVVAEKLASEKTLPYRRIIGGVVSEVVDPFIGVIALPALQIGSLLFSDSQKRHIEAGILGRIQEATERNRLLAIETARAATEKTQLEASIAELKSHNQELENMQASAAAQAPTEKSQLDATIAGLKSSIQELQNLQVRHAALVSAEKAQFAELKSHNQLLQRTLSELKSRNEELQKSNSAQIERLRTELEDVYKSYSWQWTKPLRAGARFIHHVGRWLTGKTKTDLVVADQESQNWGKAAILDADLFDSQWYSETYRDVAELKMDPLDHYLSSGASEGRNPNSLFDTAWYLREYPDVANARINPLAHYVSCGAIEGRDPHPDFSSKWYLAQNPHIAAAGINPLGHYLRKGKALGLLPFQPDRQARGSWEKSAILKTGLFDPEWYLTTYKDVAEAKVDPLEHYLSFGASEGRNPNSLFDTAWYLRENVDVARANINPLAHYASSGATEGRDPHAEFSSRWYLAQNPHLAKAGINPLSHYLREGKALGLLPFDPDREYRAHIARDRVQDSIERPELRRHVNVMTYRPRFILWIEGDDADDRGVSIQSCQAQLYADWQVANSIQDVSQMGSTDDATCCFFIWLFAGDRLSEKGLYACAASLNADPGADLIYFDEDEWHAEGRRRPFYKPDWSPDYLEAMNYIGPAACFRLSKTIDLLPAASGLYDFTLRFVERTTRMRHVGQVLLHRRVGASAPVTVDQAVADVEALKGRLRRTGRLGTVAPNLPGYGLYDIRISLKSKPLVSIVLPTAGKVVPHKGRQLDLIVNCIDTILARSTYKHLEFIIVDNGDFDRGRLGHIDPDRLKFATFHESEFNVAKKLNIGAGIASGPILLLLNDDVEPLATDWIERMLEHFEKPHVGVVGAKLLYPDLTIQHAGVVLNSGNADHVRRSAKRDDPGYFFSTCGVRNYLAVTGAAMMTRADCYREVGGYTESLAISFNDVDYCLKLAERGLAAVYAPKAELIHFESQSREAKLDLSELSYFYHRWAAITTDPFYNEDNLTVAPPTFEVHHNARLI